MYSPNALNQIDEIMGNFSQATGLMNKWDLESKKKVKRFLDAVSRVFNFMADPGSEFDVTEPALLFTPHDLAAAYEVVADANPYHLTKLVFFGRLLVNRLNSLTKNKNVIYKILTQLYMSFLECAQDHARTKQWLVNLIVLTAIGLQEEASKVFKQFVKNPLTKTFLNETEKLQKELGLNIDSYSKKNKKNKENDLGDHI